jgi:hypothetical protein
MAMKPVVPERHPERMWQSSATVRSDSKARIEAALREASEYVARLPPTPGARELKGRLESFSRVLRSWGSIHEPTSQQVEALIDRVEEVRRLATSSAPTVRRKT